MRRATLWRWPTPHTTGTAALPSRPSSGGTSPRPHTHSLSPSLLTALVAAHAHEQLQDEEEEVDKVEVEVDRAEDVVVVREVGGDHVRVEDHIQREDERAAERVHLREGKRGEGEHGEEAPH